MGGRFRAPTRACGVGVFVAARGCVADGANALTKPTDQASLIPSSKEKIN